MTSHGNGIPASRLPTTSCGPQLASNMPPNSNAKNQPDDEDSAIE